MNLRTIITLSCVFVALVFCAKSDTFELQSIHVPSQYANKSGHELNRMGLALHRDRDYEGSARLFSYAVAKDNGLAIAYFNLSCAYSLLGKQKLSVHVLRKALDLDPSLRPSLADADFNAIRHLPEFQSLLIPSSRAESNTLPPQFKVSESDLPKVIEGKWHRCSDAVGPPSVGQISFRNGRLEILFVSPGHTVSGTYQWTPHGLQISGDAASPGQHDYGPEGAVQGTVGFLATDNDRLDIELTLSYQKGQGASGKHSASICRQQP